MTGATSAPVATEPLSFLSDGLRLAGVMHRPAGLAADERRPAVILLHGFGTSKDSGTTRAVADLFAGLGYLAYRFDFRGCGQSEGRPGHILCLDQVADVRHAVDMLAARPDVDPERIAVMGHSFGAAVAIHAGGTDPRIAAVISSGGWGDGEAKFRLQHRGPENWTRFLEMLEKGKRHKAETGESLMVPRWEIVPIPEHLRKNLAADSVMEFPAETAQSMFDFRPIDVVGQIAPRPLLLFHASNDSVTPTDQSLDLFRAAGDPAELVLMARIDHFPFADSNPRAQMILRAWLQAYLPLKAGVAA